MLTVEVKVGLKKGVVDPEGANTKKSLDLLGYTKVTSVKSLKVFRLELDLDDKEEASRQVDEMCQRLLTNPVIHNYEFSFL
jgi:phosphoribosylformylglycinamidine synthase subunit PurS